MLFGQWAGMMGVVRVHALRLEPAHDRLAVAGDGFESLPVYFLAFYASKFQVSQEKRRMVHIAVTASRMRSRPGLHPAARRHYRPKVRCTGRIFR